MVDCDHHSQFHRASCSARRTKQKTRRRSRSASLGSWKVTLGFPTRPLLLASLFFKKKAISFFFGVIRSRTTCRCGLISLSKTSTVSFSFDSYHFESLIECPAERLISVYQVPHSRFTRVESRFNETREKWATRVTYRIAAFSPIKKVERHSMIALFCLVFCLLLI